MFDLVIKLAKTLFTGIRQFFNLFFTLLYILFLSMLYFSLNASLSCSNLSSLGLTLLYSVPLYYLLHYIHTYIIGRYNPSVRIIDLVSHITYVVCVNFLYISGGTYSFKVDSERQIFLRNFSWQFYILSEFLPEIC